MTREQKAAAAIGSVIAVALFLLLTWSVIGGLAVLVLGLAGAVAALRVTHPRGRRRPSLASLGLLGTTEAPSRPLSESELEAQKAELERRRVEQERRLVEREERRREADEAKARRRKEREEAAARREAERAERERVQRVREAEERQRREDEERAQRERDTIEPPQPPPPDHVDTDDEGGILAVSHRAELPTAVAESELDDTQQRIYLLNKVRLRLSDYE
jgi:hypothetical protein